MILGGFGFIADYDKICAAGYDYAELDMPEIEALSEEEFGRLQDAVGKLGFPILTGSRILPVSTPLFFIEGFMPTDYQEYLTRSCKRAKTLGIRKVILGNGKARSLSSDEDMKKESTFIDFLRMLADIAGNNDQELILEPLGPKYSNYINTVYEAVRVIAETNMPNIFAMADLRHMVWSQEPLKDIVNYSQWIHHIHIDYPASYPERNYPGAADGYDYSGFLNALKESKYNDTLTIEADIPKDWNKAYLQTMEIIGDLLNSKQQQHIPNGGDTKLTK